MANVPSTTYAWSAIFLALNKPERIAGASPGDNICYIPAKEIDDDSVTPKENDWIVDENNDTWVVKGWTVDPIRAAYAFLVRKV